MVPGEWASPGSFPFVSSSRHLSCLCICVESRLHAKTALRDSKKSICCVMQKSCASQVRYNKVGEDAYKYEDVVPKSASIFAVSGR